MSIHKQEKSAMSHLNRQSINLSTFKKIINRKADYVSVYNIFSNANKHFKIRLANKLCNSTLKENLRFMRSSGPTGDIM